MENIGLFLRDLFGKFSHAARRVRLTNQDPISGKMNTFDMKRAGEAFMSGFNAALESRPPRLLQELALVEMECSGYAFEGAALAIGSLGGQDRWTNLESFLSSVPHQRYNAISGCGGVFANAALSLADMPKSVDPFLRALLIEGYGFHQAFFNYHTVIVEQKRPLIAENDTSAYNQGIGRSIWYAGAGNADTINELINYHPESIRGDLWHGIAMQASYCGGIERDFHRMRYHADNYRADLATGCVFGVMARVISNYIPDHTAAAAQIMVGANANDLAKLFDTVVTGETSTPSERTHKNIKSRIRSEVTA